MAGEAFYESPAFTLGLRSPELQDLMWGDRYTAGSPSRLLKAPKGAQKAFGKEQISLRQMMKDVARAREALTQRLLMAPNPEGDYRALPQEKRVANNKKAMEDEQAPVAENAESDEKPGKYFNRFMDWLGNALPSQEEDKEKAYWESVRSLRPTSKNMPLSQNRLLMRE